MTSRRPCASLVLMNDEVGRASRSRLGQLTKWPARPHAPLVEEKPGRPCLGWMKTGKA
jgi:hypothetical protein